MRKVQLGDSNLYVSELALGCMSLGTERKQANYIIDQALDYGINYLDTADLYDQGRNEEIVGEAIKKRRNDIVLATKVGNHLKEDGSWYWDPSKAYIKSQVKSSLKRLQTDHIDLYQLHGGTIEDPIDETIEAFEELVEEGVIRYYGISSIRPNVIKQFVNKASIQSVMMQYSIFDRRAEEEILPLLQKQKISVVTRGSLAKGMLTKDALSITQAKAQKGYLDYRQDELLSTIKQLIDLLNRDQTLTGLAIQYALQNGAVSSIVAGASSSTQLSENVKALEQSFTTAQLEQVAHIAKQNKYEKHR
ncbi:aldo/keto reductase [Gracilibacillus dipsosauri]|uniref:Oxidoreductase n=1 Tax=Gracilibacillus dipsosauri TaxID=178340 RepID=A0A317KZC8_9BACI|nr:aldo/keto reductase [Gracilibacillus dipsosauri]PWU68586.1 oxidoreductase [Gracilibacillus dipsosauri]